MQHNHNDVIKTKNVNFYYNDFKALEDVTMNFERNRVTALIGPSGCGKSTLLRLLNRMNDLIDGTRVEGEVIFEGKNIYAPDVDPVDIRRKIGMVFQHFALFKHLKAIDNVALGLVKVKGMNHDAAYAKAMEGLKKVGLADHSEKYPAQLSGGQQQRVGIARALAMDPLLMLFDEPTSALDPELIGEVLQVMQDLAKEGMTMICVTHEMGFAKSVASEIIFMEKGNILEASPPQEMFSNPKNERTKSFLHKIAELYGETL